MKLLRTIALVRLALVPMALLQLLVNSGDFPPGYRAFAWEVLALHLVVAGGILFLVHRWRAQLRLLALVTLVVDAVLISALVLVYSWEPVQPVRSLLFLVVVEAALFFHLRGGLITAAFTVPVLAAAELVQRADVGGSIQVEPIVLRGLIAFALGAGVGKLIELERGEALLAGERAEAAERDRDDLGRRLDLLEATNRAARALGSSLDLDAAFAAFTQELHGLLPFDRASILLLEEDTVRVLATAGSAAGTFQPPGTSMSLQGSVVEGVIRDGRTIYRSDLSERRYDEEEGLFELGLRSRVVAPLQLGTRSIGALSLSRREVAAFRADELELVTLLGRLVASAVQNLRTYEAERSTLDELRRLAALRADFVSLVSHELRSPMAAVIGSALTLQQRWRELGSEQREAFLAVIADETTRLSVLIGDVLDTSRIEAGTFGYVFSDVDLAEIVLESVAAAEIGQDEVRLSCDLPRPLPHVRGDAGRLRQLVDNLISNAVKFSSTGGEVRVQARADNGRLIVRVDDDGPGIPAEEQEQIFEKFGRAVGSSKPGTGLGLFLARSFAEAHGGSLEVESTPGAGSAFTLTIPAGPTPAA
ncbi:MAG: GAF domain-containing protein [Actinobacteria bacterium]|nr:GAF domain-containing protein [Actinomycetota bacterium]